MFFGLSNYIKNLLPKRLFYRGLLIVAVPIVVLQITISVVFFDSLWIKTNSGMTRALVSEVKTFVDAYDNDETNKDFIIVLFKDHLGFNIKYEKEKIIPDNVPERWFSPVDRSLRRELKNKNLIYWFNTTNFKDVIDLRIKYGDGYFQFYIPRDRLTTSSARLFGLWITLPAFLMIMIAIIFLKNQTRPIIKLAEASEKFGKGEDLEEFRPSGALEIRKAGQEFDKMRKRILRHLNQRSEMLSGISHDLRTPLTRIKLQLAMIKDENLSQKLSSDVDEMEKMLNEYLQFASTGAKDKTETFNISEQISDLINKYENPNIIKDFNDRIYYNGRKNLINRCINNLIENSLKFAKKVEVKIEKQQDNIIIAISDDGPGIPQEEYENITKPFYKIDKSRSEKKSSVGLGLSIASDIVKSHGGDITFAKSKFGGLEVAISLPF
ncbi:MAG: sensor histidine kinase [Proteobacteria bacterium]|jgi:two-component system osmolarity sensor histidine kinase EnvZ|nr:sensor histidine kinase [Pseudomonadota bacterium]|tara:strand:- start:935 stop:2248 length:1314 start_codon:yes stop_codon:yes gene_type:complete